MLDQYLKQLVETCKEAEAAMHLSQEHMKESPAKDRSPMFKVGDKVMLTAKDVKVHQASQKLGLHQLGPFTVVQVCDNGNYELNLPLVLKTHPVVHINWLSKYTETEENGKPPCLLQLK